MREPPDHYYEMRLLPVHRAALIKLLEGGKIRGSLLRSLVTRAKAARRYDVPAVEVPWAEYEGKAKKRGESLADFIYDRGGK